MDCNTFRTYGNIENCEDIHSEPQTLIASNFPSLRSAPRQHCHREHAAFLRRPAITRVSSLHDD
eukprot:746240-Hanusia_phi.AAC.4